MMRLFVSMFIVLGLLTPLCAETILVEDFQGATPGTTVNGYNGWVGDDGFLISDTTIDQEQSAGVGPKVGDDWATVASKSFSYALGTGGSYTLSGTLYAPGSSGEYAQLSILKSADSDEDGVIFMLGYGDLRFTYENDGMPQHQDMRVANTGSPMDVKAVITEGHTDYYYRNNGDTDWIHRGSFNAGVPSLYHCVSIKGHNGSTGNIDSISLTSEVPEPSTIILCVIGLSALFALRRRS